MIELNDIKLEYLSEVSNKKITISDLLQNKVSIDVVKTEEYLRQIYGDKIDLSKAEDFLVDEKKSIKKLSKDDIGLNLVLKEIAESIEKSSFDENLENILK